MNKEKIIVIALGVVFVGVSMGAFWDIFGKNMFVAKTSAVPAVAISPTVSQPTIAPPEEQGSKAKGNKENKPEGKKNNQQSTVDASTYSQCLQQTKDERACKDCCDCLTGDSALHKACRDACPNNDFSKNTQFTTFEIKSTLGPNGDYSACTASGNEQDCKRCCEDTGKFACGDTKYCRTACNNMTK